MDDEMLTQILSKVSETQLTVARIEGDQKAHAAEMRGKFELVNQKIETVVKDAVDHSKRLSKTEGDVGELKTAKTFSAGKQSILTAAVAILTSLGVGVAIAYAKVIFGG